LQRGGVYGVRVETGTVRGIDDVRVGGEKGEEEGEGDAMEAMEVDHDDDKEDGGVVIGGGNDSTSGGGDGGGPKKTAKAKEKDKGTGKEKVITTSEEFSRIRQMSVLKVFISLR
jgi:hypothetical protein